MTKITIIAIMLVITTGKFAVAQTDTTKYGAGWGDLNYAVPDAPAFKILGTSPSNIMRPSTIKDISFSIGNYLVTSGATIPQNLSVEISPKLFNPNVSLKQFQKNAFWYTSALSIGTKQNQDKSYAMGLGLKFRIKDKQDLRLNKNFTAALTQLSATDGMAVMSAIKVVATSYSLGPAGKKMDYQHWQTYVSDAYQRPVTKADSVVLKAVNNLVSKQFDETEISKLRESVKNSSWNKYIWDVGIASLFNSKDSLLRHIQPASKLGAWSTWAFGAGAKGQVLIGLNGELRDTINSRLGLAKLNIGARGYYGRNDLKGFIEANSMMQTNQYGTFKASIGIETTFFGGLWFDFSLGLTKQGSANATFTPGFNLFFANGEKKASIAK